MAIAAGQTITHYEILGSLGAGAMGEVYRARDTQLDREVAIKVLPPSLAGDSERLHRFEREAKALASLNHPNVAQIHGVDQSAGVHFLVLELVPGENLEERIARGPLPVDETLDVCRQIAAGLEAAHEAGVIHRDLKPANVRITPDGKVKVLDFGLAKPIGPGNDAASTTDSVLSTEEGRLLGTPTYMAPEQARGRSIDRRVDVWAFGCVMFECLTGKRAFAGDTIADVIAKVLADTPDLGALPRSIPARVRELLQRCLDKDPHRRLRDVGEARVQLENSAANSAEPTGNTSRGVPVIWTLALTALAVILTALLGWGPSSADGATTGAPVRKFEFATGVGAVNNAALSPDGRRFVMCSVGRVWMRDLTETTARELPDLTTVNSVFWSPDGKEFGYYAGDWLWRSSLDGRDRHRIAETNGWSAGSGVGWSASGRIVFASGHSHLFEVPATGGTPRVLLEAHQASLEHFHHPHVLPDDRGVLFTTHGPEGVDALEILVENERRVLLHLPGENIDRAVYSPTGHVLFDRSPDPHGIWAVPFSLERLEVTGEPFAVSDDGKDATLSTDGSLLYRGGHSSGMSQLVCVAFSPPQLLFEQAKLGLLLGTGFDVSPDGERILCLRPLQSEQPTMTLVQIWFAEFAVRERGD